MSENIKKLIKYFKMNLNTFNVFNCAGEQRLLVVRRDIITLTKGEKRRRLIGCQRTDTPLNCRQCTKRTENIKILRFDVV